MNYGLKMPSGTGGQGLRMPAAPSTIPGQANLRAPAGAFDASAAAGGVNPMQMMQLMQMLMGPQQQQQAAPSMDMLTPTRPSSQETMQFIQQYGPQGQMQMQQQNDEMMQKRMQGLLALLGGQE
jgi:hypothetical protein